MLDYLGFGDESKRFENAVRKVYAVGKVLTPDQAAVRRRESSRRR
jgi:hypothetical protein